MQAHPKAPCGNMRESGVRSLTALSFFFESGSLTNISGG
jgi:hypothetical protein